MCKKVNPFATKPNHTLEGPFKLISTFHPNRYLKKVVQDIRQALGDLDSPDKQKTFQLEREE